MAVRTNGASSGDPYFAWDINGVEGYSMGIDNSDGDKLKITDSWIFNTATTFMTF